MAGKITGMGHTAYNVSNLEVALDFYCNKLGLGNH